MLSPIVQKLVDEFTKNPKFKEDFEQSFTLAYATGLEEFKKYNIHNVDDYIKYMDVYLNWVPTEDVTGTNVYYHICMFYFILNMPPVSNHQSPIDPSSQSPWRWLSEWLIEYAQEMGKWMDTPESITPESLATFFKAPTYRMQDYPIPPGGWKTFNEFFARHIKPELRPIASPDDPTVIVSPADCAFDGDWPVTEPQATVDTFDVKGVPWSVSQLLQDDDGTDYGKLFAGGTFTHSFLAPNDYHRQHAPVAGKVVEAKVIPGLCYLEVVLSQVLEGPYKTPKPRLGMHRHMRSHTDKHVGKIIPLPSAGEADSIVAPNSPGYQFLQARGLILIDNPDIGLVAVLPIGMAQVSSVVLSVKKGDTVTKGQELSYFQLGGSDIVMVFQAGAQVKFHQEIGKHYKFGTAVATAERKPTQ